jgi:hypothetical protein
MSGNQLIGFAFGSVSAKNLPETFLESVARLLSSCWVVKDSHAAGCERCVVRSGERDQSTHAIGRSADPSQAGFGECSMCF